MENGAFVKNRWVAILLKWYENNKRQLPWRDIANPYKIWISEIILQQTRVAQGLNYYYRFIDRFPNFLLLAEAEEDEVLKLWQGLGYYSRAKNLHAAAKMIAEKGFFPNEYAEIRKLKGVGEYTAAAIASFAYNLPYAVIDGNVYRVLSRYFGIDVPIDTSLGKKVFRELADFLLSKKEPALYNQAIMDFGALQCKPKFPVCEPCPFHDSCKAYGEKKVEEYPVKLKKIAIQTRYFVYLYIRYGKYIYLHKRTGKDIWNGLYEPYLLELKKTVEIQDIKKLVSLNKYRCRVRLLKRGIKHILTHQKLIVDSYFVEMEEYPAFLPDEFIQIEENERDSYAVPKLVNIIYQHLKDSFLI